MTVPGNDHVCRKSDALAATAWRLGVLAAAALLLASCGMAPPRIAGSQKPKEKFSTAEYGPASPKLAAVTPAPKGGYYKVGGAYSVAGRTYIPSDNPLYSAVGLASWYGDAFHGRLTANGEVYDVASVTAAHPTMPLPSYARVTNLSNGRSMIVRVNDRGPFARDRIIDVSPTVASMLGFKDAGTARVKVDYVGPAQLDANDEAMLLASYRANGTTDGPLLAMNEERPRVVKAATKVQNPADRFAVFDDEPDGAAPIDLAPAAGGDNLAPLILRTSASSSYAATDDGTAGQRAAALLASRAVVQIGVFGDPTNASRVARQFSRFGRISTAETKSGDHTLKAVRVVVDSGDVEPETIVAAANAAGLNDAFVISR